MSMMYRCERLSIKDVAKVMQVSEKTVRRLIDKGVLKAQKFGKQYRIKREDLETVDGEEQTEQHVEHS